MIISVALCTRNGARYIEDQVRSICEQTLPPDEIVISDDASSDDTLVRAAAIIKQTHRAAHQPKLRILRNEQPLGVAKNFQQAIAACSGELIALSDQDDLWYPQRLEKMFSIFASRCKLLLLHSNARLVDAGGSEIGQGLFHALTVQPFELEWLHNGCAFEVYLRRNLATGATTMFRRQLLAVALPIPSGWLHDEWLAAMASSIGEVDALEEPLIDYRQHSCNMIGARRLSWLEEAKRAFAPRGNTHTQQALKAQSWLNRLEKISLEGIPISQQKIIALRCRLAHQQFRAKLPENRIQRLIPVLREALTGNYSRFGRGLRGVLRDLLEPC